MKRLILICGLLASGFSFGADWVYVTSSASSEAFWLDKSFYKYDAKNNTVDAWVRSTKGKLYGEGAYVASKTLDRISCGAKKSKTLAFIKYNESGETIKSSTKPESEFSLIFPDTIGESVWDVACKSKGKGFRFTEAQLNTAYFPDLKSKPEQPRYLTPEEENKIFPEYKPEMVPSENIPK